MSFPARKESTQLCITSEPAVLQLVAGHSLAVTGMVIYWVKRSMPGDFLIPVFESSLESMSNMKKNYLPPFAAAPRGAAPSFQSFNVLKGPELFLSARLVLLLVFSVLFASAQAQNTWTGATSTDWNTASNWSKGRVPTTTDDVIISSALSNQPVISTTGMVAKSVYLQGATLAINSTGELAINGTKDYAGITVSFYNVGTVSNSGKLLIGNVSTVGIIGIRNESIFNNNTEGKLTIDRTTGVALNNAVGTFTNSGTITIGAIATVGSFGITNTGNFYNNGCTALIMVASNSQISGGTIFTNSGTIIENATGTSGISTNTGLVQNLNGGTFTITNNSGIITVATGNIWSGCTSADWNTASNWIKASVPAATDDVVIPSGATNQPIINTAGAVAQSVEVQSGASLTILNGSTLAVNGSKTIDGSTTSFYNKGIVANNGNLLIGNLSAAGSNGLRNLAIFNNNAGAQISIDRSTVTGLNNSTGNFTNSGIITIGAIATVGPIGLSSSSSAFFNNNGCTAVVRVVSNSAIYGESGFSNSGTVIDNYSSLSFIGTNTGLVQDLNGGTFNIKNLPTTGVITFIPGNIWTGCTSTDWNTSSNWSQGNSPTAADDVVIMRLFARQPVLNTTGAVANSVEMQSGTTLDIQNTGVLSVNGSKSISGNLTSIYNGGTVTNKGSLLINDLAGNIGLWNQGIFNNSECAALIRIASNQIILGGSGFSNSGSVIENASGNSDIGTNTGIVQNLNGGIFTIINNTGILTAATGNIWSGCTSTDWNTASNWLSGVVPTSTDDVIILTSSGNQPVISASDAAAQSIEVQAGATLTIQSTGVLKLYGSKSINGNTVGFYNKGTVENSGIVQLLTNILSTRKYGVWNLATFNNNTGGKISIQGSTATNLYNTGGNFTNAAIIIISGQGAGLENQANFYNNTDGQISIDGSANDAFTNRSGSFNNSGGLNIGKSSGAAVIGLYNKSIFNNNPGGRITIDRSLDVGLNNFNGPFTNAGTITIGAIAKVGKAAIFNDGVFTNSSCGVLNAFAPLINYNTGFSNEGLFTASTSNAHNNYALINDGIISYPLGNPIPNVTNNKLIAGPITTPCPANPALQIGGSNDFVVGATWYKDAALTVEAGTYSDNNFNPTNLSVGGPYTVYFSVSDPVNGCSRTISVPVTVSAPATTWYKDADGDGYSDGNTKVACDRPNGYKLAGELTQQDGDCNDNNNAINPGATEVCDGVDNNCDGSIDEGFTDTDADGIADCTDTDDDNDGVPDVDDCEPLDANKWRSGIFYTDADGDGYGTGDATSLCYGNSTPAGYASIAGDCNDDNKAINPGATEVCDGVDNNCDGSIDEGFTDTDADGIADCADPDDDNDNVADAVDCAPLDANKWRNGNFYTDADGDGYGTGDATSVCYGTNTPAGYAAIGGDCNDNNNAINPGATEVCDGVDNNCDGTIDEGLTNTDGDAYADCVDTDDDNDNVADASDCAPLDANKWRTGNFYIDADGDGYGIGNIVSICYGTTTPAGYATVSGDCNDASNATNPGAMEVCDGIDNNCNGTVDEGCNVPTCGIVTSLVVSGFTSSSATLNWAASVDPKQWQLQIKTVNLGSKWIDVIPAPAPSARFAMVGGLARNQSYVWQIRAKCGNTWTTYFSGPRFTTLSSTILASTSLSNQPVQTDKAGMLHLYPNPSQGMVNLQLETGQKELGMATIELLDVNGKTAALAKVSVANGALQHRFTVPPSLAAGMYIVKLTLNKQVFFAKLAYTK